MRRGQPRGGQLGLVMSVLGRPQLVWAAGPRGFPPFRVLSALLLCFVTEVYCQSAYQGFAAS